MGGFKDGNAKQTSRQDLTVTHSSGPEYHWLLNVEGETHTGERPFTCSVCGKGFTCLSSLYGHQRVYSGEQPLTCSVCGKGFPCLSSLYVHQRVHSGERPFTCSVCGKGFTQLSQFNEHQFVHTDTDLFNVLTEKKFRSNTDLLKPQRSHAGERPCTCVVCVKGFIQSSHLLTHQRVHTGERHLNIL
ncbi:zinc finger protein 239-like [Heterodontus francisci]|uniref:zinc finger protein 239-like n=1 Tax=Heterodontus francisci TaxID=7792 RepID=UPI00355B2F9C